MQAYNSIMSGYFCIGFIDFMLIEKSLPDDRINFFPDDYEKNDKMILKYFQKDEKIILRCLCSV